MKKPTPYYFIYTTEEGGLYKTFTANFSSVCDAKNMLNKYKEDGFIEWKREDIITKEDLKFMEIAKPLDNYDFVLKRKR